METMDGNPNRSRDSTSEPLTPPNLEMLHDPNAVVCKEKLKVEYAACDMPIGGASSVIAEEPAGTIKNKDDQGYDFEQNPSVGSIENFGDYRNQMVDMGTGPLPQPMAQSSHSALVSSTSSSSSSAAEHPMSKCVELCGGAVPACLSFGTHLAPEKQDRNVIISLEGAELWHQFFQAGTEMIITKSGR